MEWHHTAKAMKSQFLTTLYNLIVHLLISKSIHKQPLIADGQEKKKYIWVMPPAAKRRRT